MWANQYTSITSVMLLDCWAIPCGLTCMHILQEALLDLSLDAYLNVVSSKLLSGQLRIVRLLLLKKVCFADASKTGVAQEAMQNAVRKAGKAINEQEARQILGVTEQTSWEEILQKYDKLFENNAKAGSFYLQSKVLRAKECLEVVYRSNGTPS
ncbi:hypothetical protein Bca52824_047518 [Brassica carinata]|uniref:Uncharacterized protein n=2 Tax=Brassica TaxID=3705 RepID=A0A8X7REZ3_BRACI|nr:hypothetical protein Bca52824_047518 [Brassica carinata]